MNYFDLKMDEFKESYSFLNDHPATPHSFLSSINIFVNDVCKNGLLELEPVWVYPENKDFQKFCNLSKNFVQYNSHNTPVSVMVSYEDFFGYKWEKSNVEIYIEGGPARWLNKQQRWEHFVDFDLDTKCGTFEEAIIEYSNKFKELYGDYSVNFDSYNSIYPKKVIENNKNKRPFSFEKEKIIRNQEYITVTDIHLNEIWWRYYSDRFKDYYIPEYEKIDIDCIVEM